MTTSEKLHKVLARSGIGSRRHVERLIEQGRVSVDGQVAKIGARITESARVLLDGAPISVATTPQPRVLIYHKPVDVISSRNDPKSRVTIFDSLPVIDNGRWISVGRLDINTSGLLLFTNDGALAHKLMHPSSALEREYMVRVNGRFTGEQLAGLHRGIRMDGKLCRFSKIERNSTGRGKNQWYRVILTEGRYREVRRLWESVGGSVSRLIRIRYGPVLLPRELGVGEFREMKAKEVSKLYEIGR